MKIKKKKKHDTITEMSFGDHSKHQTNAMKMDTLHMAGGNILFRGDIYIDTYSL
jgi:hypothetical protein